MNVLMILGLPFLADVRVEKEARMLHFAGHQVMLACPGRKEELVEEKIQCITVRRHTEENRFMNKVWGLQYRLSLKHGGWESFLGDIIREKAIDCLHIHDLGNTSAAAANAALRCNIPYVLDLHEDWAATMDYLGRKKLLASNRFARWKGYHPGFFLRQERRLTQKANHVISVTDALCSLIVKRNGLSPSKVDRVANYLDLDWLDLLTRDRHCHVELGDKRHFILYAGGLNAERGLETAIEAMPLIRQGLPDACLVLLGDGYLTDELRMLANHVGVSRHVLFPGRVAEADMVAYINESDVCFVLNNDNPAFRNALSQKIFYYMYCKKPVVVSTGGYDEKIVTQAKCGVAIPPERPDLFAQAVLELADPEKGERMGWNGFEILLQKYSWQRERQRLINIYESLPFS